MLLFATGGRDSYEEQDQNQKALEGSLSFFLNFTSKQSKYQGKKRETESFAF